MFRGSAPAGRIKLADVARRAGVSMMTASNVLANRGGFGARTVETVRRAAREMGYRPNGAARAMAQRRFGSVALLLSTVGYRSIMPAELLDGILDALTSCRLRLTLAKLPDETLVRKEFVP